MVTSTRNQTNGLEAVVDSEQAVSQSTEQFYDQVIATRESQIFSRFVQNDVWQIVHGRHEVPNFVRRPVRGGVVHQMDRKRILRIIHVT